MEVDFSLPFMYGPGRLTEMTEEHLAYDTEWEWLMPVVSKISNLIIPKEFSEELEYDAAISFIMHPLGVSFKIGDGVISITDSGVYKEGGNWMNLTASRINQTYAAAVNFIHWYNGKS